ncbi:MAG TPA: hypothetical protein VJ673_18350 [Aromatoleum sp.]|uniref:hypothetical protein n=1 Tax=Aromatoleum sp. TaxID=2307007 RepID=UPI002B47FD1E|nr:hypothetical protein [Aromatoleum sp.]HJV27655.1 hypothetical protein [Aromatoleum sp.]
MIARLFIFGAVLMLLNAVDSAMRRQGDMLSDFPADGCASPSAYCGGEMLASTTSVQQFFERMAGR